MEIFKNVTSLMSSNVYENNVKLTYKMTEKDIIILNNPIILGFINKGIKDTGSYILVINSDKEEGATGIFCTSKSKKSERGSINKLVSNNGIYNEILNVEWEPYEYPKLILQIHKLNKDKIKNKREIYFSYNVKIIY